MPRQAQWAQALRNTRNGLFVVDETQRVLSWNRAAERLFQRPAAAVFGCHCYDVIAGRLASGEPWCRPNCGVQRCAKQGRLPPAVEIAVLTNDQRTVWLDVASIVLPGKPAPLVAHLLRDITAERSHEEELEEIRAILEADAPHERHHERLVPTLLETSSPGGSGESEAAKRIATLTARERTVLSLLADGLSTRSIAERLRSPLRSASVRTRISPANFYKLTRACYDVASGRSSGRKTSRDRRGNRGETLKKENRP